MKVVQTPPVEIALRSLGEDSRKTVKAWFGHLENWENDSFVREHSEKLPTHDDIYVLKAGDVYRIFFRLNKDQIEIRDIATRDTILRTAGLEGVR